VLIKKFKNLILLLVSSVFLFTACDVPVVKGKFDQFNWSKLDPFVFEVDSVSFRSEFTEKFEYPRIEHLFPISIKDSLLQWGKDRIKIKKGSGGKIEYIVLEARATEIPLKIQKGVKGLLYKDREFRYNLLAVVKIKVKDRLGVEKSLVAKVEKWIVTLEGLSILEREEAWYSLTEGSLKKLNLFFESEIPKNFSNSLIN
tara:strand:+ start:274 stop:873 length:600 start_codon:yes stop_codon:yes gene_type:complete